MVIVWGAGAQGKALCCASFASLSHVARATFFHPVFFYMRLLVRVPLPHFPLLSPALLTTALHALSERRTCLSDVTA